LSHKYNKPSWELFDVFFKHEEFVLHVRYCNETRPLQKEKRRSGYCWAINLEGEEDCTFIIIIIIIIKERIEKIK
jgi:hypothetical protein